MRAFNIKNMDFEFDVEDGGITIINVIDKNIVNLIIPDIIGGLPVKRLSRHTFHNCKELKSVIIPDSVDYIQYGILIGCTNNMWGTKLKYVNNQNIIENNFVFINNKFLIYNGLIYNIVYQICNDYVLDCDKNNVLSIDKIIFKPNLIKW